jgi:hypothetical protein
MVTDASPHAKVSRRRAQGATVARVEISTDEHRCGIDPLNRFVSRNWPLQLMCSVLIERSAGGVVFL